MTQATRVSGFTQAWRALGHWRVLSLTLLSVSSGMPLALVQTLIPTWMASVNIDVKTIGLLTLCQLPYTFKFLWAPLIDRYAPPLLGRKRGWAALTQVVLALTTGATVFMADRPDVAVLAALCFALALASATQDIALDGYAVETLRPSEVGTAVGLRTAGYRVGMWVAGNIAISLTPFLGWHGVLLAIAVAFAAFPIVTAAAPEPTSNAPPVTSLRDAVWKPLKELAQRPYALELAAFLLCFKLADNLASTLVRPFLVQHRYDALDVGIASGTVGLIGTMAGTFMGGFLTQGIGLRRALWATGLLQAFSNIGYGVVAHFEPNRTLLYAATAIENGCGGLGTGAFAVLLMRLTAKEFSATQYAILSSVFALGRTVAGPMAGYAVDAVGWELFFYATVLAAAPGLALLHRFANSLKDEPIVGT